MSSYEKLMHNILKIYGKQGEDWIAQLPKTLQFLENTWGLSKLKPVSNLSYNYVLEGFQGDSPIILKLSPDINALDKEIQALNAFKGFGAVSVLKQQLGAILLEQVLPGKLLKNHQPRESRIEIACKVIERLNRAPMPENAFSHIEEWLEAIDKEWDLPKEHLKRARKLKNRLIKNVSVSKVFLHGDLHQGNILTSRDDWVVIDPKGVLGYPINEIWACVDDPQYDLRYLSDYFHYDFPEVVEWYYVHLVLLACWQAKDKLDAGFFISLAESVLPMMDR